MMTMLRLATLACSPGVGVGVLECWGVCTDRSQSHKAAESTLHAAIGHLDIK